MPANMSTIAFDGRDYRIVSAKIFASIGDPYWCDTYNHGKGKPISWSIRFETESDDKELAPPNIDFEGIQITGRNWHDLRGYESHWSDPINSETGERYGMTYVYDHQLIRKGNVQISARDGVRFHVNASGQNEEGQHFAIDAPAEFAGIYVNGSEPDTDETIRDRLLTYIDDDNLTGTPFRLNHTYDSGVQMGQSFYRPANQ